MVTKSLFFFLKVHQYLLSYIVAPKWEFCWGEQGTIILTKTKKKLQPLINHMIWLFFWIEQAISDILYIGAYGWHVIS